MSRLITEENLGVMGFESVEEVSAARLGEPLSVFYVPLDQLQNYQPGSDPEELLVSSDRVVYPVTAEDEVRSSIVVEGKNDDWRAIDFGAPNLIRALSDVREEIGKEGSEFVVRVPSLNLYFIANRPDNVLMLTPIIDDPRFEFAIGRTLSAEEAFTRILPAAKDHEGLPTS